MRKLSLQLNEIYLKNLQIIKDSPNSKRTHRGPDSNRTLMRQHLTKEILEECLETIDIFKEILQDPIQKIKLMRDVIKKIKLKLYDEQGIIYGKGDTSESIYLVIKGEVSLCLPAIKQNQGQQKPQEQLLQYEYKEIDIYKEGVGFGQAQFIHKKKRGLAAIAKRDGTVVGSINADGFQQIIQLYRQRVYYKKIEIFSKCALLKHLQPYQLQFVVNNAKPYTFPISKQIVCKGEKPKALYLITSGQIELSRQQTTKNLQYKRKHLKFEQREDRVILKKVVVGVLQEGEFLGDCELALNNEFSCDAFCKTEKVKLYICDQRIIMSQTTPQLLELVNEHYKDKIDYRQKKLAVYKSVKSKLQLQMLVNKDVVLSQKQIKIKRKINNRYVEKVPSLIGNLSPRDIKKIVDIKYARIKTQPYKTEEDNNVFAFPPLKQSPTKRLARNEQTLSPLLKKLKQNQTKVTKQQDNRYSSIQNSVPVNGDYIRFQIQNDWNHRRSSTKPLLVLMKPFHKKLQSLHERLNHEFNVAKSKKNHTLSKKQKQEQPFLSVSQMKRLSQFISKIQVQNKVAD